MYTLNATLSLKGKYKTHRARFKQTGAGVNPEEPGAAVNLLGTFFLNNNQVKLNLL